MEELQHERTSRKGYRFHLTHLSKKVDAITNSDRYLVTKKDIATITNSIE